MNGLNVCIYNPVFKNIDTDTFAWYINIIDIYVEIIG